MHDWKNLNPDVWKGAGPNSKLTVCPGDIVTALFFLFLLVQILSVLLQ